jgi:hypothetical protein
MIKYPSNNSNEDTPLRCGYRASLNNKISRLNLFMSIGEVLPVAIFDLPLSVTAIKVKVLNNHAID